MLTILFLIKSLNGYLFSIAVPESLTLLVSGMGLIGATVVLRRIFKRHDKDESGN
jgi:hypothetical protein